MVVIAVEVVVVVAAAAVVVVVLVVVVVVAVVVVVIVVVIVVVGVGAGAGAGAGVGVGAGGEKASQKHKPHWQEREPHPKMCAHLSLNTILDGGFEGFEGDSAAAAPFPPKHTPNTAAASFREHQSIGYSWILKKIWRSRQTWPARSMRVQAQVCTVSQRSRRTTEQANLLEQRITCNTRTP